MTILGGVAFHFVLGAATFDQLWYVQERGFDRAEIAQLTGWIGIIAGISGNLFGGIGGDWLLKKTGMGRPMFLFFVMVLLAPINIYYRLVEPESLWFWAEYSQASFNWDVSTAQRFRPFRNWCRSRFVQPWLPFTFCC